MIGSRSSGWTRTISDPDLRLHAYVLSATPPDAIGDELRPREEWKRQGVYFLSEPDCLEHVIGHALGASASSHHR